MKDVYVCDLCKEFLDPGKDEVLHIIGSKGELYLCKSCYKKERKRLKGAKAENGEDPGRH